MTHEAGSAVPASVLAAWPGRWRHPKLLVELAESTGDLAPDHAADLLLCGLADPHDHQRTLEELMSRGEFELVDAALKELSGTGSTSDEALASIDERLKRARRAAEQEIVHLRETLIRRADQLGRADSPAPPVIDHMETSEEKRRALHEWQNQIELLERRRADELRRRLKTIAGSAGWIERVHACIDRRQFAVAESLIARGPGHEYASPLLVPPLPILPTLPVADIPELLGFFQPDAPLPIPEFARYRPRADDSEALSLLAALGGLVGGVDSHTVAQLAEALEGLLGSPAQPRATRHQGGYLIPLFGLMDERFPGLFAHSRAGMPLWVSEEARPPAHLQGPLIWLRVALDEPASASPQTALLTIPTLLRLLSADDPPDDDRRLASRANQRRVNLLRLVLAQLDLRDIVATSDEMGGPDGLTRDEIGSLLDLWSIDVDGVTLDLLHHQTGGHPVLVHETLDWLIRTLRQGQRTAPTDDDIARLRDPAMRAGHARALFRNLDEDPEALAILHVVRAFYADDRLGVFNAVDLANGIALISEGVQDGAAIDEAAALLDIPAGLDRLARMSLLVSCPDGFYTLPRTGVSDILVQEWSEEDVTCALLASHPTARLQEARQNLATVRRVLLSLAHAADNLVWAIVTDLDAVAPNLEPEARARLERAQRYARDLAGDRFRTAFEEATEARAPIDLERLLRTLVEAEPSPSVTMICDGEVRVCGNRWQLAEAFRELLRNAIRAVERQPNGPGKVELRLWRDERWAVLDVEDSGSGISKALLARLRKGDRVSAFGGQGTGLLNAVGWLRLNDGDLDYRDRSERLGGAHVRARVTLLDERAVGEGSSAVLPPLP